MKKDSLYGMIDMIKRQNGVNAYKIVNVEKKSFEMFFVFTKAETVRKAVSDVSAVTLYVDHDGKRGNSTFEAHPSMTDEEFEGKLRAARENALLVFDEPYELPEGEEFEGDIKSNLEDLDEQEVAERAYRAIKKANQKLYCMINALEIFVVKTTRRILNSNGLDKTQTSYSLSVEAIPTADGKDGSVELFETYTLGSLDEQWLTQEISDRLEDVYARLHATKPSETIDCPVVLNAYELNTLFKELIDTARYSTVYAHANVLGVGDALQSDPKGDKLNVTMRARVEGSAASALFDLGDGAKLVDKQIFKDGKLVGLFGSHRFAQYLGEEPTGDLGCIDVDSGNTPAAELLSQKHLELVYLSGLQVDVYNDYIGGEIRLAYYFDGKEKRPVTSIAMSGKLSDVLNTVVLSKERATYAGYSGPAKMLISGVKIY